MNEKEQWNSSDNLTPWQPGQSGNPKGRPKDSVTTLLKEKDRQMVADKLYELALKGDLKAIDIFLDRTEGKVPEKHEIEGKIPIYIKFIPASEALESKSRPEIELTGDD